MQKSQSERSRNQELNVAYDDFSNSPNWDNLEKLCEMGRDSDDKKFKTLYFFWVYSDFCKPVDSQRSNAEFQEAKSYLENNSSSLGDSLVTVLGYRDSRGVRSIAARVIGRYGNEECMPVLKRCLELETDEITIGQIKEAIEMIDRKREAQNERGQGGSAAAE